MKRMKITAASFVFIFVFIFSVFSLNCGVFAVELPPISMGGTTTPAPEPTLSGTTGDCTWTLVGSALTVSGNGAMGDYAPGDPSPWGTEITSLLIEEGVSAIGDCAFQFSASLASVTLADSIKSIGYGAFYHCDALEEVALPAELSSVDERAFEYCISLGEITLPDGLLTLGNWAFSNCDALVTADLGDALNAVGDYAFYHCDALATVRLPKAVGSVGESAFERCGALTSVYYGGTEEEADGIAFGYYNEALISAVWHYAGDVTVGDLVGEDGINSSDAVHLLYHILFGSERFPVNQDCDFDGDGSVSSADAIYLLYHVLFGEERYPLL